MCIFRVKLTTISTSFMCLTSLPILWGLCKKLQKLFSFRQIQHGAVPEFIDPKRSFSLKNERFFALVFLETGSINSGTGLF